MFKLEAFMGNTQKLMMEYLTFQTKGDLEDPKETWSKTCMMELKR